MLYLHFTVNTMIIHCNRYIIHISRQQNDRKKKRKKIKDVSYDHHTYIERDGNVNLIKTSLHSQIAQMKIYLLSQTILLPSPPVPTEAIDIFWLM